MTDATNAIPSGVAAGSGTSNIAKGPIPAIANGKAMHQEASKKPQAQPTRLTPDQIAPTAAPLQQTSHQEKQAFQLDGPTSSSSNSEALIPPRPEVGRTSSSPSAIGRVQHSLPDRPEPPTTRPGPHRVPERVGDRPLRDTGLDGRLPNGPNDNPRGRMPNREITGKHPRANEPPYGRFEESGRDRSDQQLPEKRPRLDYDDQRGVPSRTDTRPLDDIQQPYLREQQYAEQQLFNGSKSSAVPPRDSAMLPPRSNIPHHPDRAALIHGNRNIERPLSNNQYPERRPEPPRRDEYPTSDRTSRGASPARSDDRRPLRVDGRRDPHHDDRSAVVDRRNFSDSSHTRQSRYDDGRPPAGPRTDRPSNFGLPGASDRFHDSMKPPPNTRSAVDPNHGRLNQDSSFDGQQAEQYGRLNAGSEVPSGPRMPNGNPPTGRNARNASAPQPQIDTRPPQNTPQSVPPPSPTKDRQAPTGPSSNRGPSRQTAPYNRQDAGNASAPPTPAAESPDTVGIHPDRLKALQSISDNSRSQNPGSQNPNNIQIHGRGPSTRQQAAPTQPPPVTVPRGPSSQQTPPSSAGPSPINRGPPTGPGRGDKRFAGIQGVLQQAHAPNGADRGGQGASIRGRGGRPNIVHTHPASNSGPPTPSTQRPDQMIPQRQDLFAGRSSGPSTPQQHPAEDASYHRDARRGAPQDPGRAETRDGGRDGLRGGGGRENVREGVRDSGRDAGRDSNMRVDERRSTRHRTSRSQDRDHGPPPPPSQRDGHDYDRQPPRRDDGVRDLRTRGGPPPASSSSRPPRSEVEPPPRERRGAPPPADYRDQGDWGRGERDRRDIGGGRKRGRPGDEGSQMGSAEKRARRGP